MGKAKTIFLVGELGQVRIPVSGDFTQDVRVSWDTRDGHEVDASL